MMKKLVSSAQLGLWVRSACERQVVFGGIGGRGEGRVDRLLCDAVRKMLVTLQRLQAKQDSTDKTWQLWLKTQRSSSRQWHRLVITLYKNELYIYLSDDCQFSVNLRQGRVKQIDVSHKNGRQLVVWLCSAVTLEVNQCVANPSAYNHYVQRYLPLSWRRGRVQWQHLWQVCPDIYRPDKELGVRGLMLFKQVVDGQSVEPASLPTLCVNDFLHFCELGYNANNYFESNSQISALEKYRLRADGRVGGMLDIDPADPQAFAQWFHSGQWSGCHPWEVCRGGNDTHISLQVSHDFKKGWTVYLSGYSVNRSVETARFANALFQAKVPFKLHNAPVMLGLFTGQGLVGIAPQDAATRYCQGDFLEADHIWHAIHLVELDPKQIALLRPKIYWYPVEENRPAV